MTRRFTAALNRFCLLPLLTLALVVLLPDSSLAQQSTLTDDTHTSARTCKRLVCSQNPHAEVRKEEE
jgi:hypothetical protein